MTRNNGQAVVEYVLLLIVAVMVSATFVRLMASRNPDDPGFLIRVWEGWITTIGQDRIN